MTATETENKVVYYVHIWLADNEWSSELMEQVAQEYFAAHPELDPLEVCVSEHAGWNLTFTRDGSIVGTANDMACLSTKASNFLAKYYDSPRKWVESIRRENATCQKCGETSEVVGGGLCTCCRNTTLLSRYTYT